MSAQTPESRPHARPSWPLWVCLSFLATGAAAHVAYLLGDGAVDLSGDEAHYWEWSRRLDLSYYSKGPLVAYLIALARPVLVDWSSHTVGSEMLAVRLPAIILASVTGVGLYALACAVLRRPPLALAAVAISGTIPILAAGAMLMTIDAPLLCAWTWGLVCVERAVRRDSVVAWGLAGLLGAVGLLAKFNMVLMAVATSLHLFTDPAARRHLRRPGPYLATGIGLLGLVPIIVWNARHDWVSFRHVAGQAGLAGARRFNPTGILEYAGGQFAVVGPLWLVGMLWGLAESWRRPRADGCEPHDPGAVRLLGWAALTPWAAFLLFCPITKIQPNWPAASLVPAVILLVLWLSRRLGSPNQAVRRCAWALIMAATTSGVGLVLVAHRSDWLYPAFDWLARGSPPLQLTRPAPPWDLTPAARYDPCARLRGWAELGHAVGNVLAEEQARGREPFLLAEDYQTASLLAFYCPGEPTVYSAQSALGGRRSQYDVWENPVRNADRFIGRSCIYVGSLRRELSGADGGRAALIGMRPVRTVEHRVNGYLVRVWQVFVADRFAGFAAPEGAESSRY